MWDTIQKLEYRARAGIADAEEELGRRLNDRVLLPLKGIHGEALYLTGITKLSEKAQELELLYQKLPERRGVQEVLLLDAWSSATIEGARTTVAQVKRASIIPAQRMTRWWSTPSPVPITPTGRKSHRRTSAGSGRRS